MNISVIVVAYNEQENIQACLSALLRQKYDHGEYEVIVVDGRSEDGTVDTVRPMAEEHGCLHLVINEKRTITAGRNIGMAAARFEHVAFTDADCLVPVSWLKGLTEGYEELKRRDERTAGVGGANVPPDEGSPFQKALGIYLDSAWGAFNSAQGRSFSAVTRVKSISCTNALYKKRMLQDIGGFDERLGNISEDCDINARLRRAGFALYFIPGVAVIHQLRKTLGEWARNMASYGRGRARVTFKNREFRSPFFILPLMFALAFIAAPLTVLYPPVGAVWLYFPCVFLYSVFLSFRRQSVRLCASVATIFITTHFVYAFNLLAGTIQELIWKSS